MKVTVRITKNFKSELKPLLKKYPSISGDLLDLEQQLIKDPTLGTVIGKNVYKIRLKIRSKGKEKSGGCLGYILCRTIHHYRIRSVYQ